MRASRHYGDAAEANDIGREVGWPLRQAGLRLSADGGCLPLPVGREADLSLYERGGRQDAAPLLDDGVPALPAQVSVYQGTRAPHYATAARARARGRAAASRCEPAADAPAARDSRASLRDAQDADVRDPPSAAAPADGRH